MKVLISLLIVYLTFVVGSDLVLPAVGSEISIHLEAKTRTVFAAPVTADFNVAYRLFLGAGCDHIDYSAEIADGRVHHVISSQCSHCAPYFVIDCDRANAGQRISLALTSTTDCTARLALVDRLESYTATTTGAVELAGTNRIAYLRRIIDPNQQLITALSALDITPPHKVTVLRSSAAGMDQSELSAGVSTTMVDAGAGPDAPIRFFLDRDAGTSSIGTVSFWTSVAERLEPDTHRAVAIPANGSVDAYVPVSSPRDRVSLHVTVKSPAETGELVFCLSDTPWTRPEAPLRADCLHGRQVANARMSSFVFGSGAAGAGTLFLHVRSSIDGMIVAHVETIIMKYSTFAGIVGGFVALGVVFLAVVAVVAYCVYRRHQKSQYEVILDVESHED